MLYRPTHPVELLFCAFAQQEGFGIPGKIPTIQNNPIDLRYAGQLGASRPDGHTGPIRSSEPIAVFSSLALGIAGGYRQLFLWVAMGLTVKQIVMGREAPSNENDSAGYLANVFNWTGLPVDVPVMQLCLAVSPVRLTSAPAGWAPSIEGLLLPTQHI